MKKKIVLLGSGGHARSAIDAIEASEIAGFIDCEEKKNAVYRGYKVIGDDRDLQSLYDSGIHHAFIGIGYLGRGEIRSRLYRKLKKIGFEMPAVVDPTAVLAKDARVGEGTFIGKTAVINSGAFIGKMTVINTAAVVEHDCRIGDFCHISVNSTLCGGVFVEDRSFVGAGAVIIQGITVGENSVIGAGSIVAKNVGSSVRFRNRITSEIIHNIGGVIELLYDARAG